MLRDRLELWHEYVPLISALSREGFTPPLIETMGISGVEQNRIVVTTLFHDSLVSEDFPDELLPHFDSCDGPELLYELRFLNARQHTDNAARHAIDRRLPCGVRKLARSMKDFPRRHSNDGWKAFMRDNPDDCLAFAPAMTGGSHRRCRRAQPRPGRRPSKGTRKMMAGPTASSRRARPSNVPGVPGSVTTDSTSSSSTLDNSPSRSTADSNNPERSAADNRLAFFAFVTNRSFSMFVSSFTGVPQQREEAPVHAQCLTSGPGIYHASENREKWSLS